MEDQTEGLQKLSTCLRKVYCLMEDCELDGRSWWKFDQKMQTWVNSVTRSPSHVPWMIQCCKGYFSFFWNDRCRIPMEGLVGYRWKVCQYTFQRELLAMAIFWCETMDTCRGRPCELSWLLIWLSHNYEMLRSSKIIILKSLVCLSLDQCITLSCVNLARIKQTP